MKIETQLVGDLYLTTNCYIVWDEITNNAAVIDPGDNGAQIARTLQKNGLTLQYVLLTHGHFDHIGGVEKLLEVCGTNPKIYMSEQDLSLESVFHDTVSLDPASVTNWNDGDTVTMDSVTFRVLATPGHTPGSVCLIAEDVLFSGDTLFCGSCGRTDFPGGSWSDMSASLRRLCSLPGDYSVLPGHDRSTTLEQERKSNPFMQSALG